ncbi:hypothetical protein DM02DRAFT_662921 [Periconia macrospinosa]|uniref:Uncharacterized protein n=1 Tax=Periconia macrospinosa TaxID=97972 RepID=A0A2V1D399_9PLEO|nr:hypothetical protein DM02DRAFT_662921 [Periconia macrospinosa]
MASSSQQPADSASQSQVSVEPAPDAESVPSEVFNFNYIFRAAYPNKGQLGPSGKPIFVVRMGFPVAESRSTDGVSGHRGCPVTQGGMLVQGRVSEANDHGLEKTVKERLQELSDAKAD